MSCTVHYLSIFFAWLQPLKPRLASLFLQNNLKLKIGFSSFWFKLGTSLPVTFLRCSKIMTGRTITKCLTDKAKLSSMTYHYYLNTALRQHLLKTIFLAAFLWNLLFIIQKYIKKLMAEISTNDKPRLLSTSFAKCFNNIVLLFKNQLVQAVRCIAWRRPSFLIQA